MLKTEAYSYLEYIKRQPKTDIHNHALSSCRFQFLKQNGVNLPDNYKMNGIASLIDFSRKYLTPLENEISTLKLLLEGNFLNCIETGVKIVCPSIDYKICLRTFYGDVQTFISFLQLFQYDNLKILWDLSISRDSFVEEHRQLFLDLLQTKFFSGIDLASTENIKPNSTFVEFYKIANDLNMITKVHAGEMLGPDYIKQCILDFNPKHIQHGISVIKDKEVMQLAKDRNIVFNVCPSSNVCLGYAKNMKSHPIRKMVDNGLNITLSTDDLLFFDSDINEEYNKLFVNGTLTFEELEKIRNFGLEIFKK